MKQLRLHAILAALALCALSACGGDSTGPLPPSSLLRISTDPQSGSAGQQLPSALVVKVADAQGVGVQGVTVSWTVTSGGGSVSAATSVTDAQGLASTTWMLGRTVGTNSASASLPGNPTIPSVAFTATGIPGTPAKLAFTVQPSTVLAGAVIAPTVQVAVLDAYDNSVTSATTSVALTVTAGTGTFGATLGGASTVAVVSGVATFGNLTIDRAGTGYTLTASASGTTSAVSGSFTAIPFTMVFINSTYTPVTIAVDGTPASGPIAAGASTSFTRSAGRPASLSYYATTSGTTSTGSQIGLLVTWNYTFAPAIASADTVTMYVLPSMFFLRLKNSGASTLSPVYVNYGLTNQTVDYVSIAPNGVTYNIGYYMAYSNSNVRAYQSPNTAGLYVYWNQGTHFTLPFTNNQATTLNSLTLAAHATAPNEQPSGGSLLTGDLLPAATQGGSPAVPLRGTLHAGQVR